MKIEKILHLFLIAWTFGIVTRIAFQYLTGFPMYTINTTDFVIDWGFLLILSCINGIFWFRNFYKESK